MAGKLGMGLDKMLSNAGIDPLLNDSQNNVRIIDSESIKDDSLIRLPIESLVPGQYQPRRHMDQGSLEELTLSIKQQGIIQPIVVRKQENDKFEILAGERRWRAAQKAGLNEVPVIVMKADDRSAMAIAIIENMQRQNLNAIEESEALLQLAEKLSITHEQIGEMIGKSRSQVTNLLRLSSLSQPVKNLVMEGLLEMGHARALLALEDEKKQFEAAEVIAKKGLSVRESENLVKKIVKQLAEGVVEKIPFVKDQNLIEWENRISKNIGCSNVKLVPGSNGNGKLVLTYKNDEELQKLMNFLNNK